MRYYVYTDAAGTEDQGIATCAYLITTKDSYVTSGVNMYKKVSVSQAEKMSVGLASQALRKRKCIQSGDKVVFYIDNLTAHNTFLDICKSKKIPYASDERVMNAYLNLLKLSRECNVSMCKVTGHGEHAVSEHATVDKIARSALRYEVRRKSLCGP